MGISRKSILSGNGGNTRTRALVTVFLLVIGTPAAFGQSAGQSASGEASAQSGGFVLDGKVKHPQQLSLDALRRLPSERTEVSFQTSHGVERSSYTGVLLWRLLGEAGGIDDETRGAEIRHTLRITGRDGYAIVISTGEIAPDFGAKPAMIAYERDGAELGDQGLRVVMPGDKHGGRYVRDVVEIEVR